MWKEEAAYKEEMDDRVFLKIEQKFGTHAKDHE